MLSDGSYLAAVQLKLPIVTSGDYSFLNWLLTELSLLNVYYKYLAYFCDYHKRFVNISTEYYFIIFNIVM